MAVRDFCGMKNRNSFRVAAFRLALLLLALLPALVGIAQNGTVHGTVTAMENGVPVPQPFANVLVKGTTTGVSTDLDGRFTLTVAPGDIT